MSYAMLIEKLQTLPAEKQAEVIDFVDYLAERFSVRPDVDTWSDREFAEMAMRQAIRGMEDDPVAYSMDDLKERW